VLQPPLPDVALNIVMRGADKQDTRKCGHRGNWFEENDPEGVAFEYEVSQCARSPW
jgi:hypothetical protein